MAPKKRVTPMFDTSLNVVKKRLTAYLKKAASGFNFTQYDFEEKAELFKQSVGRAATDLDELFQGSLRMRLLEEFLQDSGIPGRARIAAFILLNSPHIHSLSFGHFTEEYYVSLTRLMTVSAEQLVVLSCRWIWLKDKSLEVFIKTIPQMHNLKQLYVPYIGTDQLLAAVGRSCHGLELLDLSGASGLTDQGAKSLYRYEVGGEYWRTDLCNSLKYLFIGGPGGNRLPSGCVAQLLVNLPQIISLGSFQQTAKAIEQAEKSRGGKRNSVTFRLQYVHQIDVQQESLESVLRTCPQLKTLFLDTPSSSWLDVLRRPSSADGSLPNISKFKTNKISAEEILSYLKIAGKYTRQLEMVNCKGSLDVSLISDFSPYLVSLEVYYSERCCHLSSINLQHLTKLIIYSTSVSGTLTEELLMVCKCLVHVTVQSANTLNTQKLERIYEEGGLQQIEELALLEAQLLDYHALLFLIEYLPLVKLIGKLEGWSLSNEEVKSMKRKVKEENYDLVLWFNLPGYVELNIDAIEM